MQRTEGGGDEPGGGPPPAVAMAPREALATIAEIASTYADETALARLSLRSVAMVMKVIADTARLAAQQGPRPVP